MARDKQTSIDDAAAQAESFLRDGVVHIKGALDERALERMGEAFDASRSNPGPAATDLDGEAIFYQDLANPNVRDRFTALIGQTPIPEILASLWGTDRVWFYYEQIWHKEGRDIPRTPWHQDAAYIPIVGDQIATVWQTLDAVTKEYALEFVRASHRGKLYNPPAAFGDTFDPDEEIFEGEELTPLPDIESERDQWDILSWAMDPGDLVCFHLGMIHGGAPTLPGQRRRTVAMRFFGTDAAMDPRPKLVATPHDTVMAVLEKLHAGLEPGEPLSASPNFPLVYSR